MTQKNRVPTGGRVDPSTPLSFTYNGQQYQGYKGDTLASALLANGVNIVGRSFKYSRPRGIVAAGAEEPNAILQVGATEATQVPNVRATQQELFDGLVCASTNGWPSVETDVMGFVGKVGSKVMPAGFYYKTFMSPPSMWPTYEKYIRKAAGLGRSPLEVDPDLYDSMNQHCDLLVVGAGPAGLISALCAARVGARVIIADEQSEFGGTLLTRNDIIDDRPAQEWVKDVVDELARCPDVLMLPRATVNGYHDHNFLTIHERLTDHLSDKADNHQIRQRLHRVRARWVVLATGAIERPLVHANNDVPGCMLASAVSTYINRYSVVPGEKLVLMTTNDNAYYTAIDWCKAGREVVAIVDTRSHPDGPLVELARSHHITVLTGSAVIDVQGKKRVSGAVVASIDSEGNKVTGGVQTLCCDTIATSGGWSPTVHLSCHTGSRPVWDDEAIGFVPGHSIQRQLTAGSINGVYSLDKVLEQGFAIGQKVTQLLGFQTGSHTCPKAVC